MSLIKKPIPSCDKTGSGGGFYRILTYSTLQRYGNPLKLPNKNSKIFGKTMEVKLSYKDYMLMRPNEIKVFQFDSVKAAYNARAIAYMMPSTHPRKSVRRYKCSVDEERRTLTVKAIGYDNKGDKAPGEGNS